MIGFTLIAETTKIHITSDKNVPIFEIKNTTVTLKKTLWANNNYEFTRMSLIGNTPLDLELDNGNYAFYFDGYDEYNSDFKILADGIEKNIKIKGDFNKTRIANTWAEIFAFAFVFSIAGVDPLGKISNDFPYLGFVFPAVFGCGFCISYGTMLIIKPRAIIY